MSLFTFGSFVAGIGFQLADFQSDTQLPSWVVHAFYHHFFVNLCPRGGLGLHTICIWQVFTCADRLAFLCDATSCFLVQCSRQDVQALLGVIDQRENTLFVGAEIDASDCVHLPK